jgi:FkbM family methyltransferase
MNNKIKNLLLKYVRNKLYKYPHGYRYKKMKFYGQKGEDYIIFEKFFINKKDGIFIELGAMDGLIYSNTKFFEDTLNWTGILIEPNPYLFKKLIKNRKNCKNYNTLISNSEKTIEFINFEKGPVSYVNHTAPANHKNKYKNSKRPFYKNQKIETLYLKSKKLQEIIEDSKFKIIDFLSLDVEGHELEVLKSIEFSKTTINVILVEVLDDTKKKNEIKKLLCRNNYVYCGKHSHNEIYKLNTYEIKF